MKRLLFWLRHSQRRRFHFRLQRRSAFSPAGRVGGLAQELGGDKVAVLPPPALRPHRIEAREPDRTRAQARSSAAARVEIGWVPLLLTQAGNARIQPGTPGYWKRRRIRHAHQRSPS
jgi:hypothetical protein